MTFIIIATAVAMVLNALFCVYNYQIRRENSEVREDLWGLTVDILELSDEMDRVPLTTIYHDLPLKVHKIQDKIFPQ